MLTEKRKKELLEDILERYQAYVMKMAYSFVRERGRAEDIAQEVFLDTYRALDRLKDYEKLSSWLRMVTRNKCIDHLKKARGKIIYIDDYSTVESGASSATENDGREKIYGDETRRIVLDLIDKLPPKQRQALILRHTDHLSYRDMAKMIGVTIKGLKSLLFRARRTLRQEMERMEEASGEEAQ